jgi:hypothetical protein
MPARFAISSVSTPGAVSFMGEEMLEEMIQDAFFRSIDCAAHEE